MRIDLLFVEKQLLVNELPLVVMLVQFESIFETQDHRHRRDKNRHHQNLGILFSIKEKIKTLELLMTV